MQDGDRHEMHARHEGQYFLRGGHHYVLYEEKVDGSREIIKNRLKFSDRFIEVTKKGSFASEMYFEMGKSHQTQYQTPFGQIALGMRTKEYYLKSEGADTVVVGLSYDMIADHAHLASCQMQITVNAM